MPENPDAEVHDEQDSPVIQQLREKANRFDAAETRAVDLERRLAVSEAGLKLSPVQAKALAATHEGDWTPDLVKATATELGFITNESPASPQIPADELAAHDRVHAAVSGTGAIPAGSRTDVMAKIAAAQSPAELDQVIRDNAEAFPKDWYRHMDEGDI